MSDRRARVQRDCDRRPIGAYCNYTAASPEHHAGSVTWAEYMEAFADYAKRYGKSQSAERLVERGGFGYAEITDHLGHPPRTWEPRA